VHWSPWEPAWLFALGSTATIMGTVKDVSGAVLRGAVIAVKHLETGLTRTDEADSSGNFSIPSLPVGTYVTAEKMWFRHSVQHAPARRGVSQLRGGVSDRFWHARFSDSGPGRAATSTCS
jgi:hypothetical protein